MASDELRAEYSETDRERLLTIERGERRVVLAQPREGYGMVSVRETRDGVEIERYYGFEMALDHAGELLGVRPGDLPVPPEAEDMGM